MWRGTVTVEYFFILSIFPMKQSNTAHPHRNLSISSISSCVYMFYTLTQCIGNAFIISIQNLLYTDVICTVTIKIYLVNMLFNLHEIYKVNLIIWQQKPARHIITHPYSNQRMKKKKKSREGRLIPYWYLKVIKRDFVWLIAGPVWMLLCSLAWLSARLARAQNKKSLLE